MDEGDGVAHEDDQESANQGQGAGVNAVEAMNNELSDDEDEDEDDDEEGLGEASAPSVLADVYLAKTIRQYLLDHHMDTQIADQFIDRRAAPSAIAEDINVPHFESLIHKFLQHHLNLPPSAEPIELDSNISIYTSAVAVYHAPSDICGVRGMARERIHATSRWGKFHVPRYDTAFAVTNPTVPGMRGLDIARVKLIFSFNHGNKTYPCALIHWFSKVDDEPDVNTGMWRVEPDFDIEGEPLLAVIHLDTMIRAAHLIGEPNGPMSADITYISALDKFDTYYVNKYIDHHAYEIAF